MFEKFRKNVADTAKELPKEDRKGYIEGVQGTEIYDKAKTEHLEQAQMTQEKWAEHLKNQEELKQNKEQIKNTVENIQPQIAKLKELGINTDKLEQQLAEILEEKTENTIEINGIKLELGPDLGQMPWTEIQGKLDELNKTLKQGEKPWRVPTKEDFIEIGKPLQEIWKNKKLSDDEKTAQAKAYTEGLGFAWDSYYWSSTEDADDPGNAWYWYSSNGDVDGDNERYEYLVRLVR